ncbi:MAG TPA: hypothetical protein PLQ66_09340 [Anaerolineae bacterium]|nr:hypothetical protein [Anaerolineae bacterium]
MKCELVALFLHSPAVIFLDEPTIGLDASAKAHVHEFIREINTEEHKTVILTSHDTQDIEALAKRVIVIDQGRLLFDGDLAQFKRNFGSGEKLVTLELAEPVSPRIWEGFFPADSVELVNIAEHQLIVKVNHQLTVYDILKLVERNAKVQDIHIEEEAISEMVRRIYEHQTAL